MNNKDLVAKLIEVRACSEAIDFVESNNYTLRQAWDKCERADWLLWFMVKMNLATQRERIHIICDCAVTALKYVPKGEDRPRLAIEAARKYADEPTEENRLAAANAANAAASAAYAANAVSAAASAASATNAAASAASAANAASAAYAAYAANAAYAASAAASAASAAASAANAAYVNSHKKMCLMIRKKIKLPIKKVMV